MRQQLMFAQLLSALIERLINQALVYNLHGNKVLTPLNGKTLTIKLAELNFPLSFSICNEQVLVSSQQEHSDCVLISSIDAIIELKKQQQLTELIKQDKLDIQGDIKIAQRFAEIAESLDIDWQSELAKRIGDIPTYKLGQLGQFIKAKLNFAGQQIQADASEWLVHEQKLIVPTTELSYFIQGSKQVETELLALEQRINKLSLQLEKA